MATDSLYSAIVSRVHALVVGLGLSGIVESSIKVLKLAHIRDYVVKMSELPCIIVARDQDKIAPRTNEAYKVDYGVMVVYAKASNQDLVGSLVTLDDWRQKVTRLFQSKEIIATINIPEVYNCRVELGTPIWPKGFEDNLDVGAVRIIVTTTEPR